jgi:hypothetical protein
MKTSQNKIIPPQVTGSASGAEETHEAATVTKAIDIFNKAKERLKNINAWEEWSGMISASFLLTDEEGKPLKGMPDVGNLIRIDIPGPGMKESNGYDWVRIEDIVEEHNADTDVYAIKVRPVQAPDSNSKTSAHFYTEEATSSFMVQRKGKTVTASEEGRNEVLNTETEHVTDKIRNAVIGTGAQLGIAKMQWKNLMKGILKHL